MNLRCVWLVRKWRKREQVGTLKFEVLASAAVANTTWFFDISLLFCI